MLFPMLVKLLDIMQVNFEIIITHVILTFIDFSIGWLVVLRLNVPVNNFSVMSGRSHRFLGN